MGFFKPNVQKLEKKGKTGRLLQLVKAKNPLSVQIDAIDALGRMADARTVVPLCEIVEGHSHYTALHAIDALGKIGDCSAIPVLERILSYHPTTLAGNKNYDLSDAAVKALKKLGWHPRNERDHTYLCIALEQWDQLNQLSHPDMEILHDRLRLSESTFQKHIADILMRMRDPISIKPLTEIIEHYQKEIDSAVGPRSLIPYKSLGQAARFAVDILALIDKEESIKALWLTLSRPWVELKSKEAFYGYVSASVATILTKKNSAIILQLLQKIVAQHPSMYAFLVPEHATAESRVILNESERLISSISGTVRYIPKLGEEWDQRGIARQLLLEVKQSDQEALIEHLINVVAGSSANNRKIVAIQLLAKLKPPNAVEVLIHALRESGECYVRAAAARALGDIGDVRATATLLEAVKYGMKGLGRVVEHDPGQDAAEALGVLKDPNSVESLLEMLSDQVEMVPKKAAIALGGIGDKRAVEALTGLLERRVYAAPEAARALGKIGERSSVTPLLKALSPALVEPVSWLEADLCREVKAALFNLVKIHGKDILEPELQKVIEQELDAKDRIFYSVAEAEEELGPYLATQVKTYDNPQSLVNVLQRVDVNKRREALDALTKKGSQFKGELSLVKPLVACLKDEDLGNRYRAYSCLLRLCA